MIHFSTWTLEEARAYCAAYAAAVPYRCEWLANELDARGQDRDLLASPEGLPELWEWATELIDTGPLTLELLVPQPAADPQPGVRPPWHSQDDPNQRLSDGALWLIDLLGMHLAALLLKNCPNAYWDVLQSTGPLHEGTHHKTKLFGTYADGVDLANNVYGAVIGHVLYGKPWTNQTSLAELYADLLNACRSS